MVMSLSLEIVFPLRHRILRKNKRNSTSVGFSLFLYHTQLLVPFSPVFTVALLWSLFHHKQPVWVPKILSSFNIAKYLQESDDVQLHLPLTRKQSCSALINTHRAVQLIPFCLRWDWLRTVVGHIVAKGNDSCRHRLFNWRWKTKHISKCSCHLARINDSKTP